MTVGTLSLLIGAHWPPHYLAVALAWRCLYGTWPTFRETVAILLHDLGYYGCREMDGDDGTQHPKLGGRIADFLLGKTYGDLIRGHSRGYADVAGVPISKLYGPDKLAAALEIPSLYVLRTRWTGELKQYRKVAHGGSPRRDGAVSDVDWFRIIQMRMARGGLTAVLELVAADGLGSAHGR